MIYVYCVTWTLFHCSVIVGVGLLIDCYIIISNCSLSEATLNLHTIKEKYTSIIVTNYAYACTWCNSCDCMHTCTLRPIGNSLHGLHNTTNNISDSISNNV